MTTLLMIIAGLLVCFGIARFNKSNKLFWITVIALASGFIGGTVAHELAIRGDKKSENTIQVSPMQAHQATIAFFDTITPEAIAVPEPASRDIFPKYCGIGLSVPSGCVEDLCTQKPSYEDSG